MGTRYTFGTSEAAALRLETIAAFFNPRSARFVRRNLSREVSSAIDLGCGPGYSTEMLSRCVPGATVYGLDKSPTFLASARRRCPAVVFLQHDVTTTPFPVRAELVCGAPAPSPVSSPFPVRAELMYARFLLSHLKNVVALVNRWAAELAPGGILLIEETDGIDTEVAVFRRYLEVNADLIRSQGAELFVGPTLGKGRYEHEVLLNRRVTMPVANSLAATWFFPNTVTVWREDAHVRSTVKAGERKAISEQLARIRDSGDVRRDITWHIRRLVIRWR